MTRFSTLTADALPFDKAGQFYRGNLHGHTTHSDGYWTTEEYIRQYRQNGYDFVAITDHFMKRFDYPIVDTRNYRDETFTTLIGAELHHGDVQLGGVWHILAVGLPLDFAPYSDNETTADVVKRALDAGAFVAVPHPNGNSMTIDDFLSVAPVHAVECFNGKSNASADRGYSWHYMDTLLRMGHRVGALSVDDLHMNAGHTDFMSGWTYVKAQDLTPESLLEALKAGHYYASTGAQLHNVEVIGREKVIVECSPAEHIIIGTDRQAVFRENGHHLTRAEFDISQRDTVFIRVTVIDQYRRRAWTNPIWFE